MLLVVVFFAAAVTPVLFGASLKDSVAVFLEVIVAMELMLSPKVIMIEDYLIVKPLVLMVAVGVSPF